MTDGAVLSVWVPLAGAVVVFALRGRRILPWAGVGAAAATAATGVLTALQVWRDGVRVTAIGGWAAPLGIEVRADGFSALFVATTAAVGLAVSVFAVSWFGRPESSRLSAAGGFWPLWLALWSGLNATFVSGDLFNIYVALEIIGLAAVGLVALSGDAAVVRAGLRYLLAATVGSLSYLLGVAFLYGAHGTLAIGLLAERVEPGPALWAGLGLTTAGLAMKTALFPLHFWLPGAHASAAAPVSAVLSALVVKASFVVLVRLWLEVFPTAASPAAAQFVGALGAAAIVWGGLQALLQPRLKLVVAHSTVSQLGYLFLLIPLALAPGGGDAARAAAVAGAAYFAVAHALAKASLFLAAGTVARAVGHDRLAELAGVGVAMPALAFAVGVAGISLVGLPPTAGFVAKWLLLEASLEAGQWWWVLFLAGGGLLTAGYLVRLARAAFSAVAAPAPIPARLPRPLWLVPLGLSLATVVVGLWTGGVLGLAELGPPAAGGGR